MNEIKVLSIFGFSSDGRFKKSICSSKNKIINEFINHQIETIFIQVINYISNTKKKTNKKELNDIYITFSLTYFKSSLTLKSLICKYIIKNKESIFVKTVIDYQINEKEYICHFNDDDLTFDFNNYKNKNTSLKNEEMCQSLFFDEEMTN